MAQDPLSLKVIPLPLALPPGGVTSEYVLLQVRAMAAPVGPRPRLTAVLCLDVSGSMQGEPLAHVLRSAERLAEILQPDDALGVVAFDTAARTVSPVRALTPAARAELRTELRTLRADGYTNMSGGLAQAALLFPRRTDNERQIILLLSDGKPNVGTQGTGALSAEVCRVKERDIALSVLGFGAHHDEDLLLALADAGGGRYAFIKDPAFSEPSFATALGAQRDVVADNVRLLLQPFPGVEVVKILGDPPTSVTAGGLRVALQDAIAGDQRDLVVQLRVTAPRDPALFRLLKVGLFSRATAGGEEHKTSEEAIVRIGHADPQAVNEDARVAVAVARADELRAEARALADRGNFPGAAGVLKRARELIQGTPGFVSNDGPLGDAFESLVDDIAAMEAGPDPDRYRIYRKAQRDYFEFATSGPRARGSLHETSPSAKLMVEMMHRGPIPPARLVVLDGPQKGQLYPMKAEVVIGRVKDNDVVIADERISRRHARVLFRDGVFHLFDLGSSNATRVNGKQDWIDGPWPTAT